MNDTIKSIVGLLQEGKPELQVAAAQVLGELRPKDTAAIEALSIHGVADRIGSDPAFALIVARLLFGFLISVFVILTFFYEGDPVAIR